MTDLILQTVADYYGVLAWRIKGRRRLARIVLPRHVAMYLMTQYTDLSQEVIGQAVGGRDHSTVIYARDKIALDMERDPLKSEVEEIEEMLREKGLERQEQYKAEQKDLSHTQCQSLTGIYGDGICQNKGRFTILYDGREYPVCGYHNTLAAFMPPDKQAA